MNNIITTISSVFSGLQQPQMQMNGYSFSKQSGSTQSWNTSLNNNAISIINAYFFTLNNNTTVKKNSVASLTNVNTTGNASISTSCFFISKPNFSHTNSKVTIQFFYYTASNSAFESGKSNNHFSELSTTLAQLYQKEVSVIATRLYYPYLNSDIISQYLAHNAPSNTFMDFQEAILTNLSLHKTPVHISGIKVQISGRLVTETVIPRITVKSCLIGTFQRAGQSPANNTTQIIDYSKFTTKNELGAFTVKVWICQRS